jgi:hypothetical protein
MNDSTNLPTGWRVALPFERCNYHWRETATHAYCGTPMCNRCAQAGGLFAHSPRVAADQVLSNVA